MTAKKYYSLFTLLLIVILSANMLNVQAVLADGEPPTEPPAATEAVTEAPLASTPEPTQPTEIPVTESGEPLPAVTETVSIEAPENTEIVVLDEQGQQLPLSSQDAANALLTSDPVWCPESVSVPTPGANGCSVSYASIAEMLAAMQADPQSFSQNGTIFLEKTAGQGFTTPLIIDDSSESLGPSFNSLNLYNLTIQGGWNPATGSTSDQTTFSGPSAYVQIGSLANPWIGSLSIRDISVNGPQSGKDAFQIFASNVALTNVNAAYSDRNGISINTNEAGTVALTNVNATNNDGSGVYIAGSDTLVNIVGGAFFNNARYGIEAWNSTSTTIPIANVWSDWHDYVPGSVVTISGNDNSLNGNASGFLFGETIQVFVQGPNGYLASCEATANSYGGWSCQITLWSSDLAVGNYTYTATGLTSGVSVSGSFKDDRAINSVTLNGGSSVTVAPGGTINVSINVTTTGSGVNNDWFCTAWRLGNSGAYTFVDHANHGGSATSTENFTITIPANTTPGTYTINFYASREDNCTTNQSSPIYSITNGVTVSSPPANTPTNTPTNTPVPPTNTATSTPTGTLVAPTNTATSTPTNTGVAPTNTPTPTGTNSVANTPTATSIGTIAPTQTPAAGSASTSGSVTAKKTSTPSTSTAFLVPLTGGEMIHLDCNSVFWAFGIKLTFYNLCEQQTSIHSVGVKELPSLLPTGFTFVKGLKIEVFTNNQIIADLPDGSGIEMDYPLNKQPRDQFAVLYWSDPDKDGKGEWIEISNEASPEKISQLLTTSADDELYQLLMKTANGVYPVLTTDKTGIFVLVKK